LGDASSGIRPRVITKENLESLIPAELLHRDGIFSLHFLLAFSVAILVVLATSSTGLSTRRREIGILKAIGWQTDEVLWRYSVESFVLSVVGASASVIVAYIWLRGFNGYWIVAVFLPGIDRSPAFDVPFRLAPVPVLLAFIVSFVIVMSGTVYSSWRAATVSPRDAMR
jgi:ABC-type antimicrobial peptide transport system permease subunit